MARSAGGPGQDALGRVKESQAERPGVHSGVMRSPQSSLDARSWANESREGPWRGEKGTVWCFRPGPQAQGSWGERPACLTPPSPLQAPEAKSWGEVGTWGVRVAGGRLHRVVLTAHRRPAGWSEDPHRQELMGRRELSLETENKSQEAGENDQFLLPW